MARKRLLWQIYPSFLLITLLALAAATLYATLTLRSFHHDQVAEDLQSRAQLSMRQIRRLLQATDWPELDRVCKELGQASDTRITVILPGGRVVADSEKNPAQMDNHSDRPEVIEAFRAGLGRYMRFSDTLNQDMMYVAVGVIENDDVIAVVRTSVAVTAITATLRQIYLQIGLGGFIVASVAAVISLVISRRISRPVEGMTDGAKRFAGGQLDSSIAIPGTAEMAALAQSMNEMARQLHDRIETVTQQRNELEAVLSSMAEGVLAVNSDGRIMSVNQAAAALLHLDAAQVKGQDIQGAIRNPGLQEFVAKALQSDDVLEADIVIANEQERFFRLHGTSLSDTTGKKYGAVVVLNDMTRMRRLENIRRDFVANVSHELRTPVTTIKGFVETLKERALDDPEKAEQFLDILSNQTNRLNAIIEDLLILSRIEAESERAIIQLDKTNIKPVISAAMELSQISAERRNVTMELACDDDITTLLNAPLLEQALINLIDNAVKYSPEGEKIQVEVQRQDEQIDIAVQDNGCGIPAEHLDRIFERFYVVDKARSRKLGGTGLGLAIVKHIAHAHRGTVSVKSTVGKGSTFTIHLRNG